MGGTLRRWDVILGSLSLFSVVVSVIHLVNHQAPLLPTVLGQWLLILLTMAFAGLSYAKMRDVEGWEERAVVGRRAAAAYVFGLTVSAVYTFHMHLTPLADIRLDAVIFLGIFVGVTAGIAGLYLGTETVRRRRKRQELGEAVEKLERRHRELQRKDEQLESFATALTHELRNSIGLISGHAELLSRVAAEEGRSEVQSNAELIVDEISDMEAVVDTLKTLARYSQTITETESLELDEIVRTAERQADIDELDVLVADSTEVKGDRDRLQELFVNAFRFAGQNGATEVKVRASNGGFVVEDDGISLAAWEEHEVLTYGNAVPDTETELFLPNVQVLASSHGWDTSIDTEYTAGTRIEIHAH